MDNNKKELRRILLESTPVLFLGAGFSYGSTNEIGKLPMGDSLKADIYNKFVDDTFSKEERKEVELYNLQDLCQFIYDSLEKKDELQKFIVAKYKNAQPQKFHLLLNRYPWKKIYSVNVDDLVERIYFLNKEELVVQNKSDEKKRDGKAELIKLHGCVNELEEGLVFSRSEYTTLISKRNFKLDSLTSDIINQNIIFVGACLDESDIDFYISQYEDAGYLRKGKLIFIDPNPKLKLKTRIKIMGGILLEWTTEQFLNYVEALKYNPSVIEKNKKALNYAGFFLYRDILAMQKDDIYESRLYEGYACKWRDVIDEWVFDTSYILEIKDMCSSLKIVEGESFCISMYGNRFAGKDCALKQIGAFLFKEGYDVIEYNGRNFSITVLKNYIESSTQNKFALLVQDAAFLYWIIEKLLQTNWGGKSLLIITTSRTYYHFKKKYYLEGNPYHEIQLEDKIKKENALMIHKKIKDKGYTGDLPDNPDEAVSKICKSGSFVNLFSDLTYGSGFKNRLKEATKQIMNGSDKIRALYLDLVLFDRADLAYYPSELFVQEYDMDLKIFWEKDFRKLNSEQKTIVDFLRVDEHGLVLKNQLFVDMLWKCIKKEQVVSELRVILKSVSTYVSEDSNTYWRIIFESLLKEDVLSKKFMLTDTEILNLYYSLKDQYSQISYYWLQVGIAEQRKKDYAKALNHLLMAHKIKPRAYQIQHAIARNYLKNANDEKDNVIAEELFAMGEKKMLELINSRENYKKKAIYFSVHCYVHEKIRFYRLHPELIEKSECRKMKKHIDSIINEDDHYLHELIKEFVSLLQDFNMLDILKMSMGDKYFIALFSENKESSLNDEEDVLIESY